MKHKNVILILLCCILLGTAAGTYAVINNNKKPVTICKAPKPNNSQPPKAAPVSIPPAASQKDTVINTIGNTGGNIINKGLAAQQGKWVYFNCDGLCTAMLDMKTGWKKLTDGYPENINVIGDWIYFTEGNILYKIKTDGTDKSQITDSRINYLTATSQYLFYLDFQENFFRINLDGSNETKLCDDLCQSFYIDNDWIYFGTYNTQVRNQLETFKMKLDGSNISKVQKDILYTFLVNTDILYYTYYKPTKLVRFNQKDKNSITLNNNYIISSNLSKDYFFYIDNTFKLYKISHNGTAHSLIYDLQKLNVSAETHLITIQDYILYYSQQYIYKISIDGKVEQIAR